MQCCHDSRKQWDTLLLVLLNIAAHGTILGDGEVVLTRTGIDLSESDAGSHSDQGLRG